jgi:hypothetical protein
LAKVSPTKYFLERRLAVAKSCSLWVDTQKTQGTLHPNYLFMKWVGWKTNVMARDFIFNCCILFVVGLTGFGGRNHIWLLFYYLGRG